VIDDGGDRRAVVLQASLAQALGPLQPPLALLLGSSPAQTLDALIGRENAALQTSTPIVRKSYSIE
jgi:hypothetical protein